LLTTFPTIQIQGLVSQIQAPIERLHENSVYESSGGKITLFGVVFDKLRKINALPADEYYTSL
jgi:predicted phosphatase